MELLIISGLSGSGKSRAAAILEDMNFYCVDNMPVKLMPRFAELCLATRGRYEKVALVTDIRAIEKLSELFEALDEMKRLGCDYRILFFEADVPTIVHRYKETRRRHPLDSTGSDLEGSVKRETELMEPVRDRADYLVDTTGLSIGALQRKLRYLFSEGSPRDKINVSIVSFGYKYGIPIDADDVFDVRFLPNPFYVQQLRNLSGLDEAVSSYVFSFEQTEKFLQHVMQLLEFSLPYYFEEGKHSAIICFGCTGGRHRSVALAHTAAQRLTALGYTVQCNDRDINKGEEL